jgi:hypothetical protein
MATLTIKKQTGMFLGFCIGMDKVSILLGCDTVSLGIWFQMFCDNIRNMWQGWTKFVSN